MGVYGCIRRSRRWAGHEEEMTALKLRPHLGDDSLLSLLVFRNALHCGLCLLCTALTLN